MELDSSQPKAKKEEENEIFWQIYRKVMVHLATPAPSSDHCTVLHLDHVYIITLHLS